MVVLVIVQTVEKKSNDYNIKQLIEVFTKIRKNKLEKPNLLENTHPKLAKFIQSICKCYKRRKLVSIPSHGVVKIDNGKFYAANGRILAMSKEPSRNAPCPCGSGRKYKKCCK